MTFAEQLRAAIESRESMVIAVSGGVDSMTLSYLAHCWRPGTTSVCHAISPAVPADASARVKAYAARFGWRLRIIDADEFGDPSYTANPVNRCYFCKSNLYGRIRQLLPADTIASGANMDDLSDYRPGLGAARERSVVHPFVEAGMDKAAVRTLAREHGLFDLADLPAQPCLSSRIETGLPILADDLSFIETVETTLRERLRDAADLRCRVTHRGIVIEAERITPDLAAVGRELCAAHDRIFAGVRPYRRGAAFLRAQ